MTTYNQTSSYNRTYEKKVIEETPRIRIGTIPQASPFTTTHIIPLEKIDDEADDPTAQIACSLLSLKAYQELEALSLPDVATLKASRLLFDA
ncbi:hypothetical protein ANCDUO_16116 [Ancylostoma duodenale]|uniref:Uncharacterized protein n=1 Tax=Ancylostoma duodenale TaxID=51022 RepID=A0A0C2FYP5_9BILA|nr:hypothetical protein ANCDUO_16116 [Ancylostoma duodenale]